MPEDDLTCLRASYDSENCRGEVTQRPSFTTVIFECEYHMDQSLRRNAETRRRYPDSDVAPRWFDPTVAGETWSDD